MYCLYQDTYAHAVHTKLLFKTDTYEIFHFQGILIEGCITIAVIKDLLLRLLFRRCGNYSRIHRLVFR